MSIEELEDTKGVYKSESINRRRTDNTMAKRQKNRQHNGQKTEEQTTQWPKDRRTDNTMGKRKRTNNDRQNIHIQRIPQNECKTIYWDLQQLLLSTVL